MSSRAPARMPPHTACRHAPSRIRTVLRPSQAGAFEKMSDQQDERVNDGNHYKGLMSRDDYVRKRTEVGERPRTDDEKVAEVHAIARERVLAERRVKDAAGTDRARASHTSLTQVSHASLTRKSHTCLTHKSHTSLTQVAHMSHTQVSDMSHTYLTHISHMSHTPHFSHWSAAILHMYAPPQPPLHLRAEAERDAREAKRRAQLRAQVEALAEGGSGAAGDEVLAEAEGSKPAKRKKRKKNAEAGSTLSFDADEEG